MLKTEKINGKIFLVQKTFYIYKTEEDQKKDQPSLITSDKRVFDYHKKMEKKTIKK
jgi:hypothetical protein